MSMTLYKLQQKVKLESADKPKKFLCVRNLQIASWLDPWMGIFKFDALEQFTMVIDFADWEVIEL